MAQMATKKATERSKGRRAAADNPNTAATVLRVDGSLLADLDAWVERLNSGNELGPKWTRSDLIRVVLTKAVRERGAKGEAP